MGGVVVVVDSGELRCVLSELLDGEGVEEDASLFGLADITS
jgi:hypothetical protein